MQVRVSRLVPLSSLRRLVHLPIELNGQAKLATVEIDDQSLDHDLPLESETQAPAVPEYRPDGAFGARRLLPHPPGERPEQSDGSVSHPTC